MTTAISTSTTQPVGILPARPVEVLAPDSGEKLILRALEWADRDEFLSALRASRWHLRRWFPTNDRTESDESYFERQVRRGAEGDADGSAWRRGAFDDAGRFIGVVNINRIERGLDWRADMCWWVRVERARRGFGAMIVEAAVQHALSDLPIGLGLSRVHAGIHPDNTASVALAQRLGFERDPRYTSRLLVGGVWQTHDAWVRSAELG